MKTDMTVVDGKLSNEQLGAMQRRFHELVRRGEEGLDLNWVMKELQRLVEGRTSSCGNPTVSQVLDPLHCMGVVDVPEFKAGRKALFAGSLGFGVSLSYCHNNKGQRPDCDLLSDIVATSSHKRRIFLLNKRMWLHDIVKELNLVKFPSFEESFSSLVSRYLMFVSGARNHGLNVYGSKNIEVFSADNGKLDNTLNLVSTDRGG